MGDKDKIKFPCIYSTKNKLVTIDDCFDCPNHNHCDIYATMLDEKIEDE